MHTLVVVFFIHHSSCFTSIDILFLIFSPMFFREFFLILLMFGFDFMDFPIINSFFGHFDCGRGITHLGLYKRTPKVLILYHGQFQENKN
ncbi:hypothetical protein YC2023_099015 [Brassica napus]